MSIGSLIRNSFNLRKEVSMGFYITDFLFRKIFRQNSGVTWAIHHTSTIHNAENIVRGKGVYPGDSPGVYINATNGISIGDYTNIGPNVGLVSSNHDFINNEEYTSAQRIDIGKHCWLGMGSIILPSVKLGDFTIVGAGSIVTKSFPDGYCVLAGNPARIIRQLNKTECEVFAASRK